MKLYSLKEGLKRARKQAGLSQAELTEKLKEEGIASHIKTIMNWEQGISEPSMGTLLKLSQFYDCDLDFLTGRIDCRTHDLQFIHDQTGLSEKAIEKLTHLSPELTEVLSLIVEDLQLEYILSLIEKRVKADPKRPLPEKPTFKDLTRDDLKIDLDGQRIMTQKYNLLDSLIQTEVLHSLPILSEAYRDSVKSEV